MHQQFIDSKENYDSFRREVLCNILIECGIYMKLLKANKNVSESNLKHSPCRQAFFWHVSY